MSVVLVSESTIGRHHRIDNPAIVQLSTKGSSIVKLTRRGYKVSEGFLAKIKRINPSFVLIGTDLDVQGTKIATVLHKSLNALGIKNYRFALTNRGYVHVGEFFDDKRLRLLFNSEWENIRFSQKMQRNFGISVGRKTFFILGAIQHFKNTKAAVKNLNPEGSNTATAITKMVLSGRSVQSAVGKLQALYYQGKIPYPRVDNDYVMDSPYDLYPHPHLREYGFNVSIVKPLEENEYPFSYKTLYLQLCNERLITPATISYYDRQLDNFFWNKETLNPYKAYVPLLELAEEFYLEAAENYKRELKFLYSPQLVLSAPRPVGALRKKNEYELEELFDEMMEEVNKKRKKAEITSEEDEEIWRRLRKINEELDREIRNRKNKGKGLNL